jgi:adenylate cyclase
LSLVFAWLQRVFLWGRGRPMALACLLALACGSWVSESSPASRQAGEVAGGVFRIIAPFTTARQSLFDAYQRALPRERRLQPVTIVEIDEGSLKAVGQWPWPRNRLADLVDAIARNKPRAIGLDIFMPEADASSPDQVAANLPPGNEALAQALGALPSHDARLMDALSAAPTVLGMALLDRESPATTRGLRLANVTLKGGDAEPLLYNYPWAVASLVDLQVAAHGQGVVSIEPQTIVRRIPLVMRADKALYPALSVEMLRVALTEGQVAPVIEVHVGDHGFEHVSVADRVIPTQANGDIWLHFAQRINHAPDRQVSAAAVLNGSVPPDALANKLVLIGLTGLGQNDWRNTPLGQMVPGIEIQAQLLEGIYENRFLLRPWWMKAAEMGLTGLLGLLMVWLIPQPKRNLSVPTKKVPKASGWLLMGGCAALLLAGYVLFEFKGWLFDATLPLMGYVLVLVCLVSSSMLETERDNLRLAKNQAQLREDAARVAGELAAARHIQLGSLPDAAKAFPGEHRFEFATLLEPAREVGGDLYDFFMIDEQRLCFVVADVSGKGVPASLFMAVTKTLAKSFAMRLPGGPEEVVMAANEDLSRENVGMLFVTLLLGVLNVNTGELTLVNAGHDAPWRVSASGEVEKLPTPVDTGGPPLCVVDDFPYTAQHLRLEPGDTLCVITDGVTEAMNGAGDLYGGQRLDKALAVRVDAQEPLPHMVNRVRDDVASFVAGAEASDDLTLLLLRWHGPSA